MKVIADISEQEWLLDLREGSEAALRRIFERHYPLLLSDIYRYVPDEGTCKDLAQEVFVELWQKRESLNIHSSLRAYLRRAAINRALNFIKANRRIVLEESGDWADAADTTLQEANRRDEQEDREEALRRAIDQLPEKCRLVFSLSRFENLSHREISQQLGISVKTIENQITKAMRALRRAMLKYSDLSPLIIWALKWCWAG